MRMEHTVVSAPVYEEEPSEDAVVVLEATDNQQFFVAVADGHGLEMDADGKTMRRSPTIATFARAVACGLSKRFGEIPDPSLFPDHFDAVAADVETIFRPMMEVELPERCVDGGAVASCVAVTDTAVHLAQTGDCRLYVALPSWTGGFRRLSHDHNGDNPREIERLAPLLRSRAFRFSPRPSGDGLPSLPRGTPDSLYRREGDVYVGGLQPTRVFGDWEYLPAVTHAPECRTYGLSQFAHGELFALCSDGGNALVEATFQQFRGRTSITPLARIADYTRSLLPHRGDDVTIVWFRPRAD